ncbi:restriction endonuclease subunit S [Pseudomonas aeruginosa]
MSEAVENIQSEESGSLPVSWVRARLSEIAAINPTLDKSEIEDDLLVSFVPMPAVEAETGGIDVSTHRKFAEVKKGYTGFLASDVLFAKITPCMENGKMAVVPVLKNDLGFGSTEFHVLRPAGRISPDYLYYFVSSKAFRIEAERNMTGAVGQRRVPTAFLDASEILLPPAAEQQRIVTKLEELFSELDRGIESLRTAQQQLKVYRQALLKHAFEGKLTAEWRARHPDKLESADALQARIQQEREARYRQQLQDWQDAQQVWETGGKTGSKPTKPKAPKMLLPLSAEELAELPGLPDGWSYIYLAYLGDLGRGKSKHRPRNDPRLFGGPYPFIQTGEVRAANRVIRKYSSAYSALGLEQSKLWPKGTLCITIAANIAETAFLGFDACFPDSIVGFSAINNLVDPGYVDFFIQGARTRIEAYAPATAQKNINLETLENLVVPLCSGDEQRVLLQILDERFSVIDQLEKTIADSLQQAEALRQSILKKAFSGQLVPQRSDEEPASMLLERIRDERAAQEAIAKRGRKAAKPA